MLDLFNKLVHVYSISFTSHRRGFVRTIPSLILREKLLPIFRLSLLHKILRVVLKYLSKIDFDGFVEIEFLDELNDEIYTPTELRISLKSRYRFKDFTELVNKNELFKLYLKLVKLHLRSRQISLTFRFSDLFELTLYSLMYVKFSKDIEFSSSSIPINTYQLHEILEEDFQQLEDFKICMLTLSSQILKIDLTDIESIINNLLKSKVLISSIHIGRYNAYDIHDRYSSLYSSQKQLIWDLTEIPYYEEVKTREFVNLHRAHSYLSIAILSEVVTSKDLGDIAKGTKVIVKYLKNTASLPIRLFIFSESVDHYFNYVRKLIEELTNIIDLLLLEKEFIEKLSQNVELKKELIKLSELRDHYLNQIRRLAKAIKLTTT